MQVIGYVASGFRKDRIWLRRTKPSKRDYQIMLLIDDSSSMLSAGPLTLSSLATIAGALEKLEVGEICIASFAERVRVLHPFGKLYVYLSLTLFVFPHGHEFITGKPFNDEAGSEIFSRFTFEARSTLLASSLASVTHVFDEAKAQQASNSETLQLCFIISDARIDSDNRSKLSQIMRTMAEQHILAVLVVIDCTEDSANSIFNTRIVEFTPTGVITSQYLENFPFPYYIVIQNMDSLPEVLSAALKQWFEVVSSSLGH